MERQSTSHSLGIRAKWVLGVVSFPRSAPGLIDLAISRVQKCKANPRLLLTSQLVYGLRDWQLRNWNKEFKFEFHGGIHTIRRFATTESHRSTQACERAAASSTVDGVVWRRCCSSLGRAPLTRSPHAHAHALTLSLRQLCWRCPRSIGSGRGRAASGKPPDTYTQRKYYGIQASKVCRQ